MKKQKKQMLLLLVVLVLVIAALVGLRAYNDYEANKEAEVEGDVIIDMEYMETEILTYDYEGETYSLERIDDVWYVKGDRTQNVKQYRIKAMLSAVAPLVAEQTIENVTYFSMYGLDEPRKTITFGDDIEQYTMYVGDMNSMTSTYYISLDLNSSTVYAVDTACVTRFNYALEDLIDAEEEETTEESGAEASTEGETESGAGTAE